jgi:hypothetical protein
MNLILWHLVDLALSFGKSAKSGECAIANWRGQLCPCNELLDCPPFAYRNIFGRSLSTDKRDACCRLE